MEQFKDVVATKRLLTFMDASKNLTLPVGRSATVDPRLLYMWKFLLVFIFTISLI